MSKRRVECPICKTRQDLLLTEVKKVYRCISCERTVRMKDVPKEEPKKIEKPKAAKAPSTEPKGSVLDEKFAMPSTEDLFPKDAPEVTPEVTPEVKAEEPKKKASRRRRRRKKESEQSE